MIATEDPNIEILSEDEDSGLGEFIDDDKVDMVEYSYKYSTIKGELEELIVKEIGRGGYLGYCHLYWATKKRILKEKYSIDWKSPSELNPHILYD